MFIRVHSWLKMSLPPTIKIASRGSALALAQANFILSQCRKHFPELAFDLRIIKTTGDKMQTASLSQIDATLPRGLFTKEIEDALLDGSADLAVHSLKDLPTTLPGGLKLGAAGKRADVRDVLLSTFNFELSTLPNGATIATSSTRRSAQLLERRPDLKIVSIRGNVGTRLQKLANDPELAGTILAAAGLERLDFKISPDGILCGEGIPPGLFATPISPDEMLPCVGQAALGIEIRENDPRMEKICEKLNHADTWHCVTAERAFLRAMGGGCQSAVGAYAEIFGNEIYLRAVSYLGKKVQRGELRRPINQVIEMGEELANRLKPK
ncbi:MAG: hydroxymethylbilane synthase [Verrucomicrobiota bacterium]